ncbi:MAG: prepilin-type N-terminal cleavage/methylation domain-containing protein [Methylotenera sp.]|nr:prepilin-type N-terminal cleavage/methylation domain-containing protein [Methylotenera sp.]
MIKQKGFTLLELLVVITLLAILAVGGLVAYDGVGDNAEASAAAFNAGTLDRAVRQYRAVTSAYPDQWDNLSNPQVASAVGGADFLPAGTRATFGALNLAGTSVGFRSAFINIVDDVWGMEEIQHITADVDVSLVAPGKAHNEGSNPSALETTYADIGAGGNQYSFISILPTSDGGAACQVDGQAASTTFSGLGASLAMASRQNAINDALSTGRCHFVLALGFGGDAASSTSRGAVQIPAAPTYTSNDVNPAQNYGRYIGLFHLGRTDGTAVNVTTADLFPRPKLIGFVDTVGNTVDINIAASRDPS